MTPLGWTMLGVSWCLIIALNVFCIVKMLRANETDQRQTAPARRKRAQTGPALKA